MSVDKPRLLLIEDEPEIRRFLRVSLVGHGFDLTECQTGREGLLRAAEAPPDIVLLDLGLPDIDGLQFIQELRGWSAVPIVVLSARGAEHDKIQALDAGADDYLTKPFGVGELLARVRVALRHARQGTEPGEPTVTSGPLRIDLAARQVTLDGHEVRLTPTEYRLLALLARHAGKVVTHRQLLKDVWGPEAVHETHYLRVYLAQLRQKLDDDPAQPRFLLTEPGVGYRLIGE
jgi:two-component system KDP operon response regulator KdpE